MTKNTLSIANVFAAQKDSLVMRRTSFDYAARAQALDQLQAMILAHEDEICAAIYADFGKPREEVMLTEIMTILVELTHTRKHLRRWMRPKRAASGLAYLGTSAKVHPTPKGVALVIAPWNFPFYLALGPAISALAAGCSVILKPSELTPVTSALINRMIAVTFPPELVTVVEGGVDVSTELLALPEYFDATTEKAHRECGAQYNC